MRRIAFVLLFVFVAGMASATSSSEVESVAISLPSPDYEKDVQCEVSEVFINSVLEPVLLELNLTDYSYSNMTNKRCYSYSNSNSVYLNVDLKRSESDYKVKRLSFSVYTSTDYDYSMLFSDLEDEKLGWTLKRKFIDFFENGTDEEYYVRISADYGGEEYDCNALKIYYDNLIGEKYFEESKGYCSIVIKTKNSEINSLVSNNISWINYFAETLRYSFEGYSNGVFDLDSLSKSLGCSLNSNDYYYPEVELECYGIYKDKTRIHFSAHTNIGVGYAYVNAYGYENGDAILSVNAYGKNVSESAVLSFVSEVTSAYLGKQYSLSLESDEREMFISDKGEFKSFSGKAKISSFSVDVSSLSLEEFSNNKYYSSENVSVSVSVPYIQVHVPEELRDAQVVSGGEKVLMPYYWGQSFIITSDKVFSSANLEENNPVLAEKKIKEFISSYVNTGSWVLDMSVTGGWYYPYPLGVRGGVIEDTAMVSVSSDLSVVKSSSESLGSISAQGVSDSFVSEFPEFEELDVKESSVLESIFNFVKGLFGK
ncbi:MAG: hypothetical protein GON13_02940 [Nanoarchaeota archaeon]|nr:hypothetical protein [Nanoarchaeota archaeon]